jgi:hypothetical protein
MVLISETVDIVLIDLQVAKQRERDCFHKQNGSVISIRSPYFPGLASSCQ